MSLIDPPGFVSTRMRLGRAPGDVTETRRPYTAEVSFNPRGPGRWAGEVSWASSGAPGSPDDRTLLGFMSLLRLGDETRVPLPPLYYGPAAGPAPETLGAALSSAAIVNVALEVEVALTNRDMWEPSRKDWLSIGERLYQVIGAPALAGDVVTLRCWPLVVPAAAAAVELAAPFVRARWTGVPAWGPEGHFVPPVTLPFVEAGV